MRQMSPTVSLSREHVRVFNACSAKGTTWSILGHNQSQENVQLRHSGGKAVDNTTTCGSLSCCNSGAFQETAQRDQKAQTTLFSPQHIASGMPDASNVQSPLLPCEMRPNMRSRNRLWKYLVLRTRTSPSWEEPGWGILVDSSHGSWEPLGLLNHQQRWHLPSLLPYPTCCFSVETLAHRSPCSVGTGRSQRPRASTQRGRGGISGPASHDSARSSAQHHWLLRWRSQPRLLSFHFVWPLPWLAPAKTLGMASY